MRDGDALILGERLFVFGQVGVWRRYDIIMPLSLLAASSLSLQVLSWFQDLHDVEDLMIQISLIKLRIYVANTFHGKLGALHFPALRWFIEMPSTTAFHPLAFLSPVITASSAGLKIPRAELIYVNTAILSVETCTPYSPPQATQEKTVGPRHYSIQI